MLITVFIFGLCIGSFLNMLAYRLVHGAALWTVRSYCPHCRTTITWYDNIPVLSWLILRGKCRTCKKPISLLYPCIEIVTAIIITGLFYKIFYAHTAWAAFLEGTDVRYFIIDALPWHLRTTKTFIVYSIFFSSLIAATRTDLEAMVIPQVFTLWLVPLGIWAAYTELLYVTLFESILGIVLGYGVLWIVAKLFAWGAGKEGMGIGDMELLALIGAFLGSFGVWISLMLGSLVGLLIGGCYIFITHKGRLARIPFGPFLAFGATIYFFWHRPIILFLLG